MNKIIEMKKELLTGMKWEEQKETVQFERVSKWIKIKHNYSPNKRNALWYYVKDENGYNENNSGYNPKNGLYLDYFTFQGKNYAIDQFLALGNPFFMPVNYWYKNSDGKYCYLSGVDAENYFSPLYIEIDEYCENVRVYREI